VTNRPGMHHPPHLRGPAAEPEKPGTFQLTLLRALELPKACREVFLLKEIQGYTLSEIAAMLGISMETALLRWKRARREFMHLGDSGAMESQK
jgi:DNA-directed RNA polymerase specialized sigma24 family protein